MNHAPSRIITMATDFGTRDSYVATMKGVIHRIHRDVHVVDRLPGPELAIVIRNNRISQNGGDGIQLIDYRAPSSRVFRIERNLIAHNAKAAVGMMCCKKTEEDFQAASRSPTTSPQLPGFPSSRVPVLRSVIVSQRFDRRGANVAIRQPSPMRK